jgi:hypothetical protein
MSVIDRIKSLFSGGSSADAHASGHDHSDHDHSGHDHSDHDHAHEPAATATPEPGDDAGEDRPA